MSAAQRQLWQAASPSRAGGEGGCLGGRPEICYPKAQAQEERRKTSVIMIRKRTSGH
jgi:hypothetical protein